MVTRRTTMRSRSGTKLYAIRDEEGEFKDIQTYRHAHAADLRHKSQAEKEATQGPIEKTGRKAATNAVTSLKSSVSDVVTAVQGAAKRAVKKASPTRPEGKRPAKKPAMRTHNPATKTGVDKAGKKTTRKASSQRHCGWRSCSPRSRVLRSPFPLPGTRRVRIGWASSGGDPRPAIAMLRDMCDAAPTSPIAGCSNKKKWKRMASRAVVRLPGAASPLSSNRSVSNEDTI